MFWSSSKKAWPVCDGNCTYPEMQGGKCVPASALCVFLGSLLNRDSQHSCCSSSRVRVIYASWKSGSPHPCVCTGTAGWLLPRLFLFGSVFFPAKAVEAAWTLVFQPQICAVCGVFLAVWEAGLSPCGPSAEGWWQQPLCSAWRCQGSARCPSAHGSPVLCALGPAPLHPQLLRAHNRPVCSFGRQRWLRVGCLYGPWLVEENLLTKGLKMSQSFKINLRNPTSVWHWTWLWINALLLQFSTEGLLCLALPGLFSFSDLSLKTVGSASLYRV